MPSLLPNINSPADIRKLSQAQLEALATEMREVIVTQVAAKGGHLAPNLGTVELTIALHLEFQTPEDRLIWDVGHQAYPHKLLTGRYRRFHTIKQHGGLSGFLSRSESPYDTFGAGHASTSLAAAMGFAVARTKQGRKNRIIAVIGDGALTGGMAYEALNNAGASSEDVIFVLNDNRMSIAPNVGAIHRYLTRILTHPAYNKFKTEVWDLAGKVPNLGRGIRRLVQKVDEGVKHMILPGGFFEDIGMRYFGPVNGHDLHELREVFGHLKRISGPCLVHVLTEKGHGWEHAARDSHKWHASAPFDIKSGEVKSRGGPPALGKVFGNALLELSRQDDRIIAITAAMPDGVGVDIMAEEFPDRVFDVGIAEQYAVTFAAGLACEGLKPVVAIYSTFLQRALDQVIHDVALQKLPVVFAMSHAGLVGLDGPTHHGALDLTYLHMIQGMTVMAPSDATELRNMLFTATRIGGGPVAIRFPKAAARRGFKPAAFEAIPIGVPRVVRQGEGLLIVSIGHMLKPALEAADAVAADGYHPTVVDARFLKPLDREVYRELLGTHSAVLTVEDNVVAGGFGSAVARLLGELDLPTIPIRHVGLLDEFVPHGDIPKLHASLGMDAKGICKKAMALLQSSQVRSL